MKKIILSLLGIFTGFVIINLSGEFIEVQVMKLFINDTMHFDEGAKGFFEMRNLLPVLILRPFYYILTGFIGSYVCLLIARRNPYHHAIALTVFQTTNFIILMCTPFVAIAPVWLWIVNIVVTNSSILSAAYFRQKA